MAFIIKKHDTLPIISATLTQGPTAVSQTPVDLTDATNVALVMKPSSGPGSGTRLVGSFVSPRTSGVVQYQWAGGDTSTSGIYNGEWEVTFTGGDIQTFPNDSYFSIQIVDDLG